MLLDMVPPDLKADATASERNRFARNGLETAKKARPAAFFSAPLAEMFAMIAAGTLKPIVGPAYPLADARRAHEDMRARATTGKVILDPVAG